MTGLRDALTFCAVAAVTLAATENVTSCVQQPDETPLLQLSSRNALKAGIGERWGDVGKGEDGYGPNVDQLPALLPELHPSLFSRGTLRIRNPGRYTLVDDVVFEPSSGKLSWDLMPVDSQMYPQLGGYFLGFFAAISIEADNVELDCQNYEIRMSKLFHKIQRFFSIIELCSAPFKKGQGPPQFASNLTTSSPPVCAKNVTISNCKFGLSSHHAIHGNDNEGVTLRNLKMYDFEVAGVALNGASKVSMKGLDIGPSLTTTFSADLSAAVFLDHIVCTLMPEDPVLLKLLRKNEVTLRGSTLPMMSVFQKLRTELQQFINTTTGPLLSVFGDGSQLPDGSAIYGLLLHRSGVAISDFGFCPDDVDVSDKMVKDVHLENISIHDLSLKVDQVPKAFINGKPVMGMSGDVFNMPAHWNKKKCYQYLGNSLSDAVVAIGELRRLASKKRIPTEKIMFYWGSSNMPQQILDWAGGHMSCKKRNAMVKALSAGKGDTKFTCLGDFMSHVNKGAVGMRLGFQEDVVVKNITIKNLDNQGFANAAPNCVVKGETYQGADVRGVSLAHMRNLKQIDVSQSGSFSSTDASRVFPVTGLSELQMRADDAEAGGAAVEEQAPEAAA